MRRPLATLVLVLLVSAACPPRCGAAAGAPVDSLAPSAWAASGRATLFALRLKPGQDLRLALADFAKARKLHAASIVSCAGSLARVALRYANQPGATIREGHFEIVSLTGTLSAASMHVHASVSDSTGATIGGHLMDGSRIYTTAEIVLAEMPGVEFAREVDSTYGYRELAPRHR